MHYKEVIGSSWELTKANKNLIIWYGFLPGIITTLVGIIYMGYQFWATYKSPLFSEHSGKSVLRQLIELIVSFITNNPKYGIILLIIAIIIVIIYLLLPTLCQGALIQLTARIQNGHPVKMVQGITYGLLSFLTLFEYHLLIKAFGLLTIITEAAFIGRNLGWGALKVIAIPFVLFFFLSFFIILLFTYTEYFLVIDKNGVFESIKKSSKLVVTHWAETILIAILMIIITVRILVNIFMVLAIPAVFFLSAAYIATVTLAQIGIIIGIIVGAIALLITAYFNGILTVFATFVWTKTFLDLTSIKEEDVREVNNG